jgi:GNAT superfamily N-acetyltransferase
MDIRPAQANEVDRLARVWYDAWQDAHAAILPAELARDRTEESFRQRLFAALADTRVAGPVGAPLGFCTLKDDELYQLFVTAQARGSGVAAALITDAEARLRAKGVTVAWLACAIGNTRAARFYEKQGWHLARTFTSHLETARGTFDLDVWRYEKRLIDRA